MKTEEVFYNMLEGGLVNSHLIGYLKNDQSQSLSSSLKNIRRVETTVMKCFIMDPFEYATLPASSKTKKPNYQKITGLFEHTQRSLNNLNRDNHFSCQNFTLKKLKVA